MLLPRWSHAHRPNRQAGRRLGVADEVERIGVYKPGAEVISDQHAQATTFRFDHNPYSCPPLNRKPGSLLTRRWRKRDANPRSPYEGSPISNWLKWRAMIRGPTRNQGRFPSQIS